MMRAVILGALLTVVWPAGARADTEMSIAISGIDVEAPGSWEYVQRDDSLETWTHELDDGSLSGASFTADLQDGCPSKFSDFKRYFDPDERVDITTITHMKQVVVGVFEILICIEVDDTSYGVVVAYPDDEDLRDAKFDDTRELVRRYAAAVVAHSDDPPVEDPPVEDDTTYDDEDPVDGMADKSLHLPHTGFTITAPYDWFAEDSERGGGDEIIAEGAYIGDLRVIPDDTCADGFIQEFTAEHPDDPYRALTTSVPAKWIGVEWFAREGEGRYADNAWEGIYCRELDGGRTIIVLSAPEHTGALLAAIEAYVNPPAVVVEIPDPVRRPSRGFLAGVKRAIWPRTLLVGVVRHEDELGDTSFGGGLSLSRLTWREAHRAAIGYDITGAIAKDWWAVSAQLRPGVSPLVKDFLLDAYLALGVDGTGGEAGPQVPFAPVGGVGADVISFLPFGGVDLAGQVLADREGLHSYTLHGGLVFGDGGRMPRIGVSYVSHLEAGSVWLVTLGFTNLGAER